MPLPPTQSFHVIFCQALARFRTKPCERLLAQGKCDFQERDPRRDGPGRFDHPNLPMITPIYLRLVGFYCNYLNWVHYFVKGEVQFYVGNNCSFFFRVNFLDFILRNNWRITMSQRKCIHSFRQRAGLHNLLVFDPFQAAPPSSQEFFGPFAAEFTDEKYLEGISEGASFGHRFGTASSPWSTPGSRYLCTSPQPTRHVLARKPGLYLDISVMRWENTQNFQQTLKHATCKLLQIGDNLDSTWKLMMVP